MAFSPNSIFNVSSIPDFQKLLVDLATFVTTNITPSNVETQQGAIQAVRQTLVNALNLWNAYEIQILMNQEYLLIERVIGIPISPTDTEYIRARITAMQALYETVYTLPIIVPYNIENLNNSMAALPAYDLLSYFVQYNYELLPIGLTDSNFFTTTVAMTTAWQDAFNYLSVSGNQFHQSSILPVSRMYYCSLDIQNFVSNLTLNSSITNLIQVWNSIVALPTLLRVFSILYQDPSSQLSQSINCIKFVMLNLLLETDAVLASFNAPNNLQFPTIGVLRAQESLMDFANRTTGNFSNWSSIAAANDLLPPYTGIIPAPNIATPGQKLYLPPYSSLNNPIGSYSDSYLGTDINFGYPYTPLTVWSGDFGLISGVTNYTEALARRVLTPIGSLIYHSGYGSYLPIEIGSISTAQEASLLLGDLKNALLADTRTQTVNRVTAYPVKFGQIVLTSLVTPYGSAQQEPFNLVVIPSGNQITTSTRG